MRTSLGVWRKRCGSQEAMLLTHHDDVIKWRYFPRYWPLVRGIHPPVPDEFPSQRPVTRSFDVFFDLRVNKPLIKQSKGWWFETTSCLLWRHCNVVAKSHHIAPCAVMYKIDQYHKSQNEPIRYPTIHHSEQKCAHLGIYNRCILGFVSEDIC